MYCNNKVKCQSFWCPNFHEEYDMIYVFVINDNL